MFGWSTPQLFSCFSIRCDDNLTVPAAFGQLELIIVSESGEDDIAFGCQSQYHVIKSLYIDFFIHVPVAVTHHPVDIIT